MTEQLHLLDRLLDKTTQPRWQRLLGTMRTELRLPMADVLERVPGKNASERIRTLGVARNTYYEWLKERFRPSLEQARMLEKVTGFPAAQIHGGTDEARGEAAEAPAVLGEAGEGVPRGSVRSRAKRRRVLVEQRKRRHHRAARRRDQ